MEVTTSEAAAEAMRQYSVVALGEKTREDSEKKEDLSVLLHPEFTYSRLVGLQDALAVKL